MRRWSGARWRVCGAAALLIASARGRIEAQRCPPLAFDSARLAVADSSANRNASDSSSTGYHAETIGGFFMRSFGPLPLARAAALAGFDEWRHPPGSWNQEGRGFRDRLDSRLGAEMLAHTLRFVVARAAQEQTGRYRRCSSCETLRERIEYALMTPLRVETPTGVRLSAVAPLTEIGSSLVVTSVRPGGFSFRQGALGGASGLASTALTSLARELWPWHWRPPGF